MLQPSLWCQQIRARRLSVFAQGRLIVPTNIASPDRVTLFAAYPGRCLGKASQVFPLCLQLCCSDVFLPGSRRFGPSKTYHIDPTISHEIALNDKSMAAKTVQWFVLYDTGTRHAPSPEVIFRETSEKAAQQSPPAVDGVCATNTRRTYPERGLGQHIRLRKEIPE